MIAWIVSIQFSITYRDNPVEQRYSGYFLNPYIITIQQVMVLSQFRRQVAQGLLKYLQETSKHAGMQRLDDQDKGLTSWR
jgi:hypothetical protein